MKLSIIIPVFNVERHIEKTLSSLISQTEENFEVIIVNDGSTDSTYNVVKKFISENKLVNIRLINKDNMGVSSARNIGFSESTGRYVTYLDGDDYISENYVKSIYNLLKYQEPDILCWGYNIVNENNITIANYFEKFNSNLTTMTGIETLEKYIIDRTLHICTGSAAYKKDMLLRNNITYTEGCSNGEDQEFIIKTLLVSKKISFINQVLSFYVQREDSISNTYNIKRFDAINAMKRTCEYINNTKDKRLDKVLNTIKNEKIIENFFYNYNSCMTFLFTHKNLSSKEALRYIDEDIERNYPGLNKFMRLLRKDYKGSNKKMFLQIKVFLFVPNIYYKLVEFKNI